MTETLARLHGELLSVGFEVTIAERPFAAGRDTARSRLWLEELAARPGIDALIDVVGDGAPVAVDVWIVDPKVQRYQVSRVALEMSTENASERLAIRAIEVLRSRLLETHLGARERRGEPVAQRSAAEAAEAAEVRPPRPNDNPERLGLELGAAALASFDGVGPAILPIVRFDWAVRSWVVQATLAGFGTRPTVATEAGNARVAQQYGLLGGYYGLGSDRWFEPFIALSAGFLRTSVEGRAESPKVGHSAQRLSFLLDGGLGARFMLRSHYYLTLAADVQLAEPYIRIRFVDEAVASSGGPNLLLTLTIGAWL